MKFVSARVALFAAAAAIFGGNPAARAQVPAVAANPIPATPLFSDKERASLVAYWNTPGRYVLSAPPEASITGPWQVRLTPEGSTWLLGYQRIIGGSAKTPPTRDARAQTGPYVSWENWIAARVTYDRALAQQAADTANRNVLKPLDAGGLSGSAATGGGIATLVAPALAAPALPPAPGPAPADLIIACGNPPPFANIVTPLQYQVTFDSPTDVYTYVDNPKLRDRYAYYRFPRGVVTYGTRLKDMSVAERDSLFRDAGFSPSEQKIFTAVSGLEGGFETVQTYDTGYVSIGFIQFVTLAEGVHDLSEVLLSEKANRPGDFKEDFHRFGMDVRPDKTLVVIDPATGAELSGNPAVLKIIDDKRLTAVFQRAGRRPAFRIAQIKIAKSFYWPVSDALSVALPDGSQAIGTVGDIVHSEAGLATLLDRKINTGNIRSLPGVVAQVMAAHNLKTLADAGRYEHDIIAGMKYRADFLADASLAQPPLPPVPVPPVATFPVASAPTPKPVKTNGKTKPPTALPTASPAPAPVFGPAAPPAPSPTPNVPPESTPTPGYDFQQWR